MESNKVSVILSTYNQPNWLRKVLWGYENQTERNFEIIIADDGSEESTRDFIEYFKKTSKLKIIYLWQKDDGFRKNRILNKAVVASNSDYIIFTDGDCIPRKDFIQRHLELRKTNHALSGGNFKLPLNISNIIDKESIDNQQCFNRNWLLQHGLVETFKLNKLTSQGAKEWFLNNFTTTKATFDGMNASAWKKDILEVNGFDERMGYGGEDRELGERLMNNGIKFIQARYSLICLHLHHDRPYVNTTGLDYNKKIRKVTKKNRSTTTEFGINKR